MIFRKSPSSSISTTVTTAHRKSHPDLPTSASSTPAALCPFAPCTLETVVVVVGPLAPPFRLVNFDHTPHPLELPSRDLRWRARSMTIQPRSTHFPRVEIVTCWRMSVVESACLRRLSLLANSATGPRTPICAGREEGCWTFLAAEKYLLVGAFGSVGTVVKI